MSTSLSKPRSTSDASLSKDKQRRRMSKAHKRQHTLPILHVVKSSKDQYQVCVCVCVCVCVYVCVSVCVCVSNNNNDHTTTTTNNNDYNNNNK